MIIHRTRLRSASRSVQSCERKLPSRMKPNQMDSGAAGAQVLKLFNGFPCQQVNLWMAFPMFNNNDVGHLHLAYQTDSERFIWQKSAMKNAAPIPKNTTGFVTILLHNVFWSKNTAAMHVIDRDMTGNRHLMVEKATIGSGLNLPNLRVGALLLGSLTCI